MSHMLHTGKAWRHFVNHRWAGLSAVSLKHLVEAPHNVRVTGVRPVGICGAIAPMFVHPEPGRGIFPHVRLERIPTGLRDLSQRHVLRGVDLAMKNHSITTAPSSGGTVRSTSNAVRPFRRSTL